MSEIENLKKLNQERLEKANKQLESLEKKVAFQSGTAYSGKYTANSPN